MKILRATGKFGEAVECQNKIRQLHNRIVLHDRDRWKWPVREGVNTCAIVNTPTLYIKRFLWPLTIFLGWPITWGWFRYTEYALSSMKRFVFLSFSVYVVFVGLFAYLGDSAPVKAAVTANTNVGYLEQPFMAMTGTSMFNTTNILWNGLNAFAVIVGLVHLGLFISHLYFMLGRKD